MVWLLWPPLFIRCPFIVTIYDLSFIHYPELFQPLKRWYLRTFTQASAKRAKAIITISESTRQDVIRFFEVAPAKVKTIYCGADEAFRPLPPAKITAFRAKYSLPDQFILRHGTIEPRKNVLGVIRAYAAWRNRDSNVPPLFITGGKGWYYQQVFDLVEALNLREHIIFPGYIPQDEMVLWYNAASMLVYPSFFEGFGLPVLEAMACGTPVITSNASSLPEVAGSAALLIDPHQIDALREAMETLFRGSDLQISLRQAGLEQARQFSWSKAAVETLALYNNILQRNGT